MIKIKTSKYIQIALLLFIIGTTLTLFIDAKMYADNPETKLGAYFETKHLDDFSVVVAEEYTDFQIVSDTVNTIIAYYKHQGIKTKNYEFEEVKISQDTLFVGKTESAYKVIINGKSIKKIIGKPNSTISVSLIFKDSLSVDLDETKLTGTLRHGDLNMLDINAKNQSVIEFRNLYVKIPDSISKKPAFKLMGGVLKQAKITLKDNSRLTMPNVKKLDMDADNSSTYNIKNMVIYNDN